MKKKIVEDMDIQVQLVSPLAQLSFEGIDAQAVHGDISTVHINVNERLYAFLLSIYVRDLTPLLTVGSGPAAADSTALDIGFDGSGGSVLVEEQWGLDYEGQEVHRRSASSSALPTVEEKDEAKGDASAASLSAGAQLLDSISVNLSFHAILIDVQLSPPEADTEDLASHLSGSSLHGEDASLPRPSPHALHFSFLDPSASRGGGPVPFAHVRARTLQLSAQLSYDRSASKVVRSAFECSVAMLSVVDSRSDCAHPLFRQIVGGHKDDLSQSTARSISRRRASASVSSSPAASFASLPTASSAVFHAQGPHTHHQSLDLSRAPRSPGRGGVPESPAVAAPHHSRLVPSQFLLSPWLPKSPSRSPLPVYRGPSASLQPSTLQAPLPPTILPDLLISGRQDGDEQVSLTVDFTAPRLVLSSGCLSAVLHATDIFSRITDVLLKGASQQSAPPLTRRSSAPSSSAWRDDPSSAYPQAATSSDNAGPSAEPLPPLRSPSSLPLSAPSAAVTAIRVQLCIHDPQVWLMADVSSDDHGFSHPAHLTTLSTGDAAAASAPSGSLLHPATSAGIRRSLNLPEWPPEHSPLSAGFSDDDDLLDEEDDEDDEPTVATKKEKLAAHSAPRSLSCIVVKCQVRVEATIEGDDLRASVDMTELQALVCYRAHHLRLALLSLPPVPIFEPLHLLIDYTAEKDPSAPGPAVGEPPPLPIEHIVINLSTVDACFSFLQISTAASILHGLNRVLPPDFFFSSGRPVPPVPGAFSDPALGASVVVKPTFKGSVQVHTAGVELAIVNDAPGYYVPLLRFALSTFVISVSEGMPPEADDAAAGSATSALLNAAPPRQSSAFSWPFSSSSTPAASPSSAAVRASAASVAAPSSTTFAVSVTVAGSYYNSEIQQWEALFDPWSLDVSGDDALITASSAQVFRLTITPSAIFTLARGVESFQTHFLPTITALMATKDEAAPNAGEHGLEPIPSATTPPRQSSAYSSPIPSRKGSLFSPSEHGAATLAELKHAGAAQRAPVASASADKASYFLVRNETGSRLRFLVHRGRVGGGFAGQRGERHHPRERGAAHRRDAAVHRHRQRRCRSARLGSSAVAVPQPRARPVPRGRQELGSVGRLAPHRARVARSRGGVHQARLRAAVPRGRPEDGGEHRGPDRPSPRRQPRLVLRARPPASVERGPRGRARLIPVIAAAALFFVVRPVVTGVPVAAVVGDGLCGNTGHLAGVPSGQWIGR